MQSKPELHAHAQSRDTDRSQNVEHGATASRAEVNISGSPVLVIAGLIISSATLLGIVWIITMRY